MLGLKFTTVLVSSVKVFVLLLATVLIYNDARTVMLPSRGRVTLIPVAVKFAHTDLIVPLRGIVNASVAPLRVKVLGDVPNKVTVGIADPNPMRLTSPRAGGSAVAGVIGVVPDENGIIVLELAGTVGSGTGNAQGKGKHLGSS